MAAWKQWPHKFMPTADGVTLHYVEVGPKDGLPIVMVHGWPDLWFGWRHQIAALSPKYRLIVPDMRGFGQSSKPRGVENYGSKKVTDDFAALLDGLNIEKAVFIGHDWGGQMVWRMCLFHPERVLAVCGICTPFNPPSSTYLDLDLIVSKVPQFAYQKVLADSVNTGKKFDRAPRRFFTAMFRKHSEMGPRSERLSLVQQLQTVDSDSKNHIFNVPSSLLTEEELQYYIQIYSEAKFETTCNFYATRKIDFENEKHLPKKITHRALFIAAADDPVLRPEMAKNMHKVIPKLETKLIKNAGHWVLWEQTEQVNALLDEWLATIPIPETNAKRAKL